MRRATGRQHFIKRDLMIVSPELPKLTCNFSSSEHHVKHSVQSLCIDMNIFSSWSEMDSHILCLFQLCFCCCPEATGLQWSLISAYILYWTKVNRAPPPSIGYDDKLLLPALHMVRLLRCSGTYQHCFIISNKLMLLLTNGTKRKQVIVERQRKVC